MKNEHRRAVGCDVVHGTHRVTFRLVVEVGADEGGVGVTGGVEAEDVRDVLVLRGLLDHGGEISGAVVVTDGADAVGLCFVATDGSEQFLAADGAYQSREMSSGGGAHDTDAFAVDAVILAVGPEPTNGGLAILDLCWKKSLLTEAVFDAGDGVPVAHHGCHWARELIAALPSSSMDVHDEGQGLVRGLFREVKVQALRRVAIGNVGDVAFHPDARGERWRLCFGLWRLGKCRGGEGEKGEE